MSQTELISNDYFPTLDEYNPNLTKEDWVEILQNKEITSDDCLQVLECILKLGGESTCAHLSRCFGNSDGHYNAITTNLCQKIKEYKKLTSCIRDGAEQFWPVLFTGKYIKEAGNKHFVWKLRPELYEALLAIGVNDKVFTWIDFYIKFARALLAYKNDRPKLVEIIKTAYVDAGFTMPKMEEGEFTDVDPFTTMGIFNRGLTNENRTKLIKTLNQILDLHANIPEDYLSLPVLNAIKSTFYGYKGERGESDIDNLWQMFQAATDLADNYSDSLKQNFCHWYDICEQQKNVKWNLTMALYWMRPDVYIGLDAVNRIYLENHYADSDVPCLAGIKANVDVPNADTYLAICETIKEKAASGQEEYKSISDLSYLAWCEAVPEKKFNDYDATLLLSEYLLVEQGEKQRKDAIEFVSNAMRAKATADGFTINKSFRSSKDIESQMQTMEGALKDVSSSTALFKKIVDIYKNDQVAYAKLVNDTYEYFEITDVKHAWLLTWNPNNWEWKDYDEAIKNTTITNPYITEWASQSHKPQVDDVVYLMVLGKNEKNAIVARGLVTKTSYDAPHWNPEKAATGEKVNKIGVAFTGIVDYRLDKGIKLTELESKFPAQKWNPQGTGISIKEEYVEELNAMWNNLNDNYNYTKALSRKSVNKSLLVAGITVPVDVVEPILRCLGISKFVKGDKLNIHIVIDGNDYDAILTNVNHSAKYDSRTVVQIRYAVSSPIALKIQEIFKVSYQNLVLSKAANTETATSTEVDTQVLDDADDSTPITAQKEYYELWGLPGQKLEIKCYPVQEELPPVDIKASLETIGKYIAAKGFTYDSKLIKNFYLSLKSKPFVILGGTSGTGKTKLVELFAEAMGAEYKLVPVRPDWSDATDLFGHVNLKGVFEPGAIIDTLLASKNDPRHAYFLCLDEMNLARVEYYLSDFLSIMESRKHAGKHIITKGLVSASYFGVDVAAQAKYKDLILPDNLYIIGTVNMDETTFPFSKKVLDRANTIEFSDVDLSWPDELDTDTQPVAALTLPNSFLQAEYLQLADCKQKSELAKKVCTELEQLNQILRKADAHVGYRVRDEIVFYMCNNAVDEAELLTYAEAMDLEIMQKVLPRINGSNASMKTLLERLKNFCEGKAVTEDNLFIEENSERNYPLSAAKLSFMLRRFEDDGFTSYWL